MTILTAPNPFLRRHAVPVVIVNHAILDILKEMKELMLAVGGLGLAANQVGVPHRVFVTHFGSHVRSFINPKILWAVGECSEHESCLSMPGLTFWVTRAEELRLEYCDFTGRLQQETFSGLDARIIQHENDHLNGILIGDADGQVQRHDSSC